MPETAWLLQSLTPSGRVRVRLHRQSRTGCHTHPDGILVHVQDQDAMDERDTIFPASDTRWPTHCGCGHTFRDDDLRAVAFSQLVCTADGALMELSAAPVGGVYDALPLLERALPAPDGQYLVCVTPLGLWELDFQIQDGERGDMVLRRMFTRTQHPEPAGLTVTPEAIFWDAGHRPLAAFRITDGVLHAVDIPASAYEATTSTA